MESLESRVVLYTATSNMWPHPELITLSFVPDGTDLGGVTSNLFSSFNSRPLLAGRWMPQILKAAQTWAQQTNINFALVPDDGTPSGWGDYQQGDPGFGDIRIDGWNFGSSTLALAVQPPPVNNFPIAGDIDFNTGQAFNINMNYDLFTVATHEIGHALGLLHSNDYLSQMFPYYNGRKPNLSSDDIAGIRSIYGGPRNPDAYDAASSNDTFATATNLNPQIDPVALTGLVPNLDLTTSADIDNYTFTAPAGTSGTLALNVQSSGLSLLSPKVTVYAADQTTVLGSANGAGQYGATLSVTIPNVSAGERFYVKVQGADTTTPAFNTGAYAMTLNFGNGPSPSVPLPNTQVPTGDPIQGGGGVADSVPGHNHGHGDRFGPGHRNGFNKNGADALPAGVDLADHHSFPRGPEIFGMRKHRGHRHPGHRGHQG